MTQLTETIIAIVVPGDAWEIVLFPNIEPMISFLGEQGVILDDVSLPAGEWSIVGLVWHKDGDLWKDFDAAEILEVVFKSSEGNVYLDYRKPHIKTSGYRSQSLSLASLLQSKGLYWENPIKEPYIIDYEISDPTTGLSEKYDVAYIAWQAAQSKCLKPEQKVLILKQSK